MSTTTRSISPIVALAFLLLPASARVIWMPEPFHPSDSSLLQPRAAATCGGDSSLNYCGGNLPSGFCCSSAYTCLALSTSASVQAAICCPDGESCTRINPISCDISLQNTTITQLHANPPQKLKSCGTACCPMGYECQSGQCVATVAPSPPGSKPKSTSTSSPSTTTSTSASSTSSSTSSPSSAATVPLPDQRSPTEGSDWNGKSFAAGFVPGIALGAIITACLFLLFYRRKHRHSETYVEEKRNVRDTLTDLSPLGRPTMHGRCISDPVTDPSASHRTDFLRGTSPQGSDDGMIANGYRVDVCSPATGPKTPQDNPPKVKALFSRSPFMAQYPSTPPSTQAPIPAHLKRGTLSFKISPVRALKKQKSTHSLRRQMLDGTTGTNITRSNSNRSKLRPDMSRSRSASTETIQVLMPSNEPYTPDGPRPQQELPEHIQTLGSATYQPPSSSTPSEWTTTGTDTSSSPDSPQPHITYASSSRYPSDVQGAYVTPTRPPVPRLPNAADMPLGSPYTPTNAGKGRVGGGGGVPVMSGGLGVERNVSRRDTTFSSMMERAGLRRSDFVVGGKDGRQGR